MNKFMKKDLKELVRRLQELKRKKSDLKREIAEIVSSFNRSITRKYGRFWFKGDLLFRVSHKGGMERWVSTHFYSYSDLKVYEFYKDTERFKKDMIEFLEKLLDGIR